VPRERSGADDTEKNPQLGLRLVATRHILIWSDGREQSTPPPGRPIEIPAVELPELIDAAQHQLRDFLGLIESWVDALHLSRAQELIAALDRHFNITDTPDRT
jgi:hypothetical protein